ncbi:tetratricopeptide repeat protein [Aliidiomarina halalkaliphila]|uniref:Tetratricopeptide repeat protein n=1 Tax=Aliidiomarina halalkaliphila TaxID=2593535 RepID=A0A552X4C2_9GAMM|nr:serine/threonine-protein kinase [Aliidiomarina halalkaliphila]TRW49855.1 tetratricopeptide repeat protein [Aliidiomarina halalkaliphila]
MDVSNPQDGNQDDVRTTVVTDTGIAAGTLLANRFLIEGALGEGGQAQVYRAHDQVTDKIIAIKVLARRSELSEGAIQRLRDELLAARQISDPTIIRVHEFYRDDAYVFYTMDCIEGTTLSTRLQKPITLAEADRWIQQLIQGVRACHRGQVIHGDIKPANLLINEKHDLIVADFGISAAQGTQFSGTSGTDGYRAPELDAGETATSAIDIYALGRVVERLISAVKGRDLRSVLWRSRWRQLARKMRHADPNARISLSALSRYTSAQPIRPSVMFGGLIVMLLSLTFIYQFYQDRSGAAPAPIVESGEAPARIAFVRGEGSSELQQILQMLTLTYTAEPDFSVIPSGRVDELLSQLGLNPFQQERDRQRLATLLNVSTLVFLESPSGTDTSAPYIQVYLSHFPDNRIHGVEAFALTEGPLPVFQVIRGHLDEQLGRQVQEVTSTPLSPELTALILRIQEASDATLQSLIEEYRDQYQQAPAFWYALADWAYWQDNDAATREYLAQLFATQEQHSASYWVLQGQVLEAELNGDLESAAVALDRLLREFPERPDLLEHRAQIAQQLDDIALAERLLERALAIDPNSGYRWFELGRLRINQGDIQSAIHHELAQGLIRFRQQEDLAGQGTILNAFGVAYLRMGNLERSRDYFEEALAVREQANDLSGQAVTLGNLANVLSIMQEYDEADAQLSRAADIFAQMNDHRGMAQVMNDRGYVAEEQGLYEAALRYFRDALDLRMRYGSTSEQAESISNVAFVYFLSGDFSQADIFLRQAYTLFERIGHQNGMLRTELQLANLHLHRGEYQIATRILARVSGEVGDHRPIEQAFLNFVLSHRNFGLGNMDTARTNIAAAIAQATTIQDYRAMIENALWQYEMCFWLADRDCLEREYMVLMDQQDGFTREQAVVFAWLNWSYHFLQEQRTSTEGIEELLQAVNEVNLPLHTELKIRLSLWEFVPDYLDDDEKRTLRARIRSSYYKEYLHVHYLMARDQLEAPSNLASLLARHPDHWRNHVFIVASDASEEVIGNAQQQWLNSLSREQAQRYQCWFLMECAREQ